MKKNIQNIALAGLVAAAMLLPATQAEARYCPRFADHRTVRLDDGGCKFGPVNELVRGRVPNHWRAVYWDGDSVRRARSGKVVRASEATFYRVGS